MPYVDLYSKSHTCTNKHEANAVFKQKHYTITPRVLQIYPPKRKSRPEIYVPSVRKRQGNIFGATLTIRPREEMGVMLC